MISSDRPGAESNSPHHCAPSGPISADDRKYYRSPRLRTGFAVPSRRATAVDPTIEVHHEGSRMTAPHDSSNFSACATVRGKPSRMKTLAAIVMRDALLDHAKTTSSGTNSPRSMYDGHAPRGGRAAPISSRNISRVGCAAPKTFAMAWPVCPYQLRRPDQKSARPNLSPVDSRPIESAISSAPAIAPSSQTPRSCA